LFELKFRQKNPTKAEKKTIQILDEYIRRYGELARMSCGTAAKWTGRTKKA
jgi:hypothetical protein